MEGTVSDLERAIERSLRSAVEGALGLNGDPPKAYPGGERAWLKTCVGMRMNEIRQWLHEPSDVAAHLKTIQPH